MSCVESRQNDSNGSDAADISLHFKILGLQCMYVCIKFLSNRLSITGDCKQYSVAVVDHQTMVRKTHFHAILTLKELFYWQQTISNNCLIKDEHCCSPLSCSRSERSIISRDGVAKSSSTLIGRLLVQNVFVLYNSKQARFQYSQQWQPPHQGSLRL